MGGVALMVAVGVLVMGAARADMCDRRDRRMNTAAWKGDIGDLEVFPGGSARDRLQVVGHHRVRRFLSFPTGSVFSVIPKFIIPFYSQFDGYIVGSQLYSIWFDLKLPNSTLMLKPRYPEEEVYSGSSQYSSYTPGSSQYSSYTPSSSQYSSYTSYHASGRTGRALDENRLAGFKFLQDMMDSVGLEGRTCVLRAVCEVAEDPVSDLGIVGEIVNIFFSAGYGSRAQELEEYIAAEESGRRDGGCEAQYSACPYSLLDQLATLSSFFHRGLADAGDAQ